MRGDNAAGEFREQRVGVQIAAAGQREPSAAADVGQDSRGATLGGLVVGKQARVGGFESGDAGAAVGGGDRLGHSRGAECEPFPLLNFQPLPGRIAEHHIEARLRPGEDSGKQFLPGPPARIDGRVFHQAVGAADVVGEVGERASLAGRPHPQGELGNLDRLRRQVHAVQVFPKDKIGDAIGNAFGGRVGGRVGGGVFAQSVGDASIVVL